jgi:chromodomain-helicase-DNA-binding protein 4
VSLKSLLKLQNGQNALDFYEQIEGVEFSDTMSDQFDHSNRDPRNSSLTGKRTRTKTTNTGFVDSTTTQLDSEDDETFEDHGTVKRRRLVQGRISLLVNRTSRQDRQSSRKLSIKLPSRSLRDEDCSETDSASPKSGTQPSRGRRSKANAVEHTTRPSHARPIIKLMLKDADDEHSEADELAGEGVIESEDSSNVYVHRRERRRSRPFNIARGRSEPANNKGFPRRVMSADSSTSLERQEPSRRSGRQRTIKSMKEQDMDEDLFADEIPLESAPRAIGLREIFQPISKQSRFRSFHRKDCDVCGGTEHNSNKGTSPLIYCQGCSSSIHKVCLGYRSSREHLVTKVGHENFVMQCRRCIGVPAKKDSSAPRLDTCSGCKKLGGSCAAFSQRKTLKQEEKLREENDGEDPITAVPDELINSDANLLFRCKTCQRGWHFEHLPARSDTSESPENLDEQRYARFEEYNLAWQCKDCCEAPAKVQGLVAWRPLDRESYHAGQTADLFREDEKEYLIKWEGRSHFHCSWMPGAWVWGVTVTVMRKAFFRRSEGANLLPKWTADDAIAEEWLRVEIVFDVRYDDDYTPHSDASDRAHINNVDEVFVKFQGLGYDEAVWEKPPPPDQTERWSDFVAAYNEYLAGRYFKQQPASVMKERIHKFRSEKFEQKIELKKQPLCLTGGQIMPYQMEGLNWLLYNFYRKKNVILADEMGLGKTIQVISLLASLVKDKPQVCVF